MEFLTRLNRNLHLVAFCLAVLPVLAAQGQADLGIRLKTTVPILTASPNVCELQNDQRACAVTVALVWEVPRAGNFCLYHLASKTRLECWTNKWSGVHQFQFSAGNTEKIMLIREESNVIVTETEVRVIGAIEQQVRARRRSGIWRMF